MYRALFYEDPRGEMPVRTFIESLNPKSQQKVLNWLDFLQQKGPDLRRPYADKVRDKLYELRVRFGSDNVRILYFFFGVRVVVLLHGFRKKDRKIDPKHLMIAEKRRIDFITRYEKNKLNEGKRNEHTFFPGIFG